MYMFYLQRSCFNCFVVHGCGLECLKAPGDSHKQPKLPSVAYEKELFIGAFKTQSGGLGRWLIGFSTCLSFEIEDQSLDSQNQCKSRVGIVVCKWGWGGE